MKHENSLEQLADKLEINSEELHLLQDGNLSDAYSYTKNDKKFVVRVTNEAESYQKDRYAHEVFKNSRLQVPEIVKIGELKDSLFYSISEYLKGESSDSFSQERIDELLPVIWESFSTIYTQNIEATSGFGYLEPISKSGESSSWNEFIAGYADKRTAADWRALGTEVGINTSLVDSFLRQLAENAEYIPEDRRLIHGDLGFDNLLIHDSSVSGVIDWAQMSYGDWYYDFATMDFWWPGRFGDARQFGEKYGLEISNLDQRKAAYWARRALSTMNFAVNYQNQETLTWLQKNL